MLDIKTFLSNLPNNSGVYQMLGDNGEVLYVGKARNLKKRVTTYFSKKQKDIKTDVLMSHVKNVEISITRNEIEALLLECNLIKKHKPRYNVLFRDDKSYPYIVITNEHPYPRIDFYRGALKKDNRYFGPYPSAAAVRETIHLIQKVFQIRTCHDNYFATRSRPCLHHQIGLCSGSCAGLIDEEEYQQNVRHTIMFLQGKNDQILKELQKQMDHAAETLNYEYAAKVRNQITKIRKIQERQYVSATYGDADIIGLSLQTGLACIHLLSIRGGRILGSRTYFPRLPANSTELEIVAAFITQHYLSQAKKEIPKEIIIANETPDKELLSDALSAASQHKVVISTSVRGERKKWLEMATTNAQQSLTNQLVTKANLKERFLALQEALELNSLPKRIECFDISHSMGEETVASCVVFDLNGAAKSDYRRFNIKNITGGDDIAAMRQVLTRRYKNLIQNEGKVPDIVLIDGGLAQLNAAQSIMQEYGLNQILLVGVAKGADRKAGLETLHLCGQSPIHLEQDSLALHLIQQIRDEAHRFAITGHRNRRDKKRRTSTLEEIPGIGAKRRRELLHHFGGIQALNRASLEELAKVPGISLSLAQSIYEALHNA